MSSEFFKSPLTGLNYISLADLFPPLPDEAVRYKMIQNAVTEIKESERESFDPWCAVFVALVDREIAILTKAKSMLIRGKFSVKHHGSDPHYAVNLSEFEIIPGKEW